MDFKDFDIFLITKDNWEKQKEVFYGYKTFDDNGIWLHVYWENNNLLIKGSYIQPYINIYKDENYWAISNNFYYLEQHLLAKNIKLTKNKFFEDWDFKNESSFGFCISCKETDTLYNEIKLNTNFSYVKINGDLNIIDLPIECFTIPIQKSRKIIFDWYERYHTFCKSLPYNTLIPELSGGFDSRVTHCLWHDIDNLKICSNWNKSDSNNYYDGLIGRLYLGRKHKLNYRIKRKSEQTDEISRKRKQNATLISSLFNYGITTNTITNIDSIELQEIDLIKYYISGTGMELHKSHSANSVTEIGTIARRAFLLKYLIHYYSLGIKYICPFLDSELLKIKTPHDFTFPLIMFGLFDIQDEQVPVWSADEMYFIKDEEVEKALAILEDE